ncbi:patatin-like phospholipase family protein [Ilumatobacter sp.]|uniref:patatin-like phospholipase family protein n=1 Tax=Ilumatobacter sp. TaxID=1967498 RepID=UPI003B530349
MWGCGALGGVVAEQLCRSRVGRLTLRDHSTVAPGILVRQNFEDDDIGDAKAIALAARLRRIRPDFDVTSETGNLARIPSVEAGWSGDADVIIDLTASPTVAKRLEHLRATHPCSTSIVVMMIGHDAQHGLTAMAKADATGGAADAVRKAKVVAARRPELRRYACEFWPDPARADLFFPEPGCSSPTFTGSATDVAMLATSMLLCSTRHLADESAEMAATFVSTPVEPAPLIHHAVFQPDLIVDDPLSGYEVRISPAALAETRAWIRRSERLAPGSETGGVLFGERDDALRTLWITDVLGPPPDSQASPQGFVCGTAGIDSAARTIAERSRHASQPVGMWHTHPETAPVPSPTDFAGMHHIITNNERSLPKQLLVIFGGNDENLSVGAYLYDRHRALSAMVLAQPKIVPLPSPPDHRIGLALSGGGFRAVAFHLGVLRALHDRRALDHIEVLSTVSGGSLIGALWAYSDEDFETFDDTITTLLRSGLNRRLARSLLASRHTPPIALGTLRSPVTGIVSRIVSPLRRRTASKKSGRDRGSAGSLRRRHNRTSALESVIHDLLGNTKITEPRRKLHVIINACDLRSGSAFRFGSAESGCTRYGTLAKNDVDVATAVAASAAYPVALPPLDVTWNFVDRRGNASTERLLITDGGVFDNLGTSCLLPDRDPRHSTNVHPVDFIVSADAGHGQLADRYPTWWPTRMKRSFEAVYRKVQDNGKALLHQHATSGALRGFVLPFLGQNDAQLRTIVPANLIRRDDVVGYPTNFSKMSQDKIDLIATRGEQLTRLMIEAHAADIA